jgi:RNA polymerase sigma-70 factor, ECF subfamily
MQTEELLPELYGELRRIAARYLRGANRTLQPTALVHEAWMKMSASGPWKSRGHFLGTAALSMRQVLVHEHERRSARKRRGMLVELDSDKFGGAARELDAAVLAQAFARLQQFSEPVCKVVELRLFGGFSVEEAAEFLSISPATVKRHWSLGRAFIAKELGSAPPELP